jgi:hypothetical protein
MPGTRSFQHFYKRTLLDSNRENKMPRIEMDRSSDTPDDVSFLSTDSADELHHLASDGVHSPPSTLASRSHIDTNGTSPTERESVETRILNQDTFQSNFGLPSKFKRKNKGTFVYSTKSS